MSAVKIPVGVHVGRVYGNGGDYVTIEVSDGINGARVLEIEMTPEEAARLFLFNGTVDLWATFRIDNLGKTRELLRIEIEDMTGYSDKGWRAHVEEQTAKYEADGWFVSDYEKSRRNFHNANNKDKTYRLTLTRYVDVEE